MTIRVVLADDQALLRATFKLLLESTGDITVVAEASNGTEAVQLAHDHEPDVVVMDIRMPAMDGIEATRRITSAPGLDAVRILVLTTFEEDDLVLGALRAGASGFLGKGVDPETLIGAIRTVADGDQLLSATATRSLIGRVVSRPEPQRLFEPTAGELLTARETEIVTLVALGLSNTEIADRLYISPATAKTHVNRAMTKIGARDRAQLVVFGYETGLVGPNTPA